MPGPRAAASGGTRGRSAAARGGGAFQTSADGDAVWSPPSKPPPGFPPLADDDNDGDGDPSPQLEPTKRSAPRPAARPITSNDAAGGLLALFAWPLVLNYLRHGPAGPKAWLKAKFLNIPTGF